MNINGKVLVVTGGGSGIAREVVLLLLKKGARVAALDMNPTTLAETVTLAGDMKDRLTTHVVNITDRAAVAALPKAILAQHGIIDGVLNIAGIIQKFVLFKDLEYADIEKVMNVNFYGMVNMVKEFLPILLTRPEGLVVNVSSMGGYLPVPAQTIYGASKAAVKLFTEGLHSEMMSTNVQVTLVFPGSISTNIAANSGVGVPGGVTVDTSKIKMTPAVVAGQVLVKGIEDGAYHVFIGNDAKTMDFLSRLMPEKAAQIIYKQMASLLPK
jgi:NAD(P)-dependent dehydrogenase (short-subunit alcohol dehydrogenase family)